MESPNVFHKTSAVFAKQRTFFASLLPHSTRAHHGTRLHTRPFRIWQKPARPRCYNFDLHRRDRVYAYN